MLENVFVFKIQYELLFPKPTRKVFGAFERRMPGAHERRDRDPVFRDRKRPTFCKEGNLGSVPNYGWGEKNSFHPRPGPTLSDVVTLLPSPGFDTREFTETTRTTYR